MNEHTVAESVGEHANIAAPRNTLPHKVDSGRLNIADAQTIDKLIVYSQFAPMTQNPTPSKLRPSSIKIFLADGSPTGLRIVEKSNWIGQGVVFPRSGFSEVKARAEFGKTAVYVLSGLSENTGRERVYIGEGDPVRPRLDSHAAKKDFWTMGCVFTSKDNNLNKAHVQYLESRLCELAAVAKRVELDNGNNPGRPSLSEADQAEMEAFLAEMLVCFPVLGLSAFERPAERASSARVFNLKEAKGFESDEGFVVRAGAIVKTTEGVGTNVYLSALRRQLVDGGVITIAGDKWTLAQDYLFGSPSTAAAVLLGRSANGRVEWKDDHGRTLKQVQEGEGQSQG